MSVKRRSPVPLDPSALRELALAYVARYATSQGRLRGYLQRKLRERGWAPDEMGAGGDPQSEIDNLLERFVGQGFVDDAAWARMRSDSLARRGFGARRIDDALRHAGIDQDQAQQARPEAAAQRQAALVLARRRRFGPFAAEAVDSGRADPRQREKQIAAMLRAGHPLDIARAIVDAASAKEAEEWVDSA